MLVTSTMACKRLGMKSAKREMLATKHCKVGNGRLRLFVTDSFPFPYGLLSRGLLEGGHYGFCVTGRYIDFRLSGRDLKDFMDLVEY